ncbi:MAG: tRNA (N(6)-L-threonylcarbamoyladenosine(37)-C(2))-methylthiotransferase MtaB [candidate division KSB1 bacterium]|nr:tRNA (N(6)-L-threonylcarbamoyladenosine(37)-C(2))-methylthiotransferase MtaB [candidate division KSB1 bacterium]
MTISFYTIGCRLNQAETAVLQNHFEQSGHRIVEFGQSADIVVVNTCTVTERGDRDTRKTVRRIQRECPDARIALIGCQAQTQAGQLTELPGVHWVVGNAHKMNLPAIIDTHTSEPVADNSPIEAHPFILPAAGIDRQHTRANLKIQDGCNFFCTFCEVPYARGRARSRVFDDILQEAQQLVRAGHQEIVLSGINIGTYQYKDKTLTDVIRALEPIEGLQRIRISSIEGKTVDEALLHLMANSDKICRHLHISMQSGSDTILKAMKRRYTVREFSEYLQQAVEIVPNISLGADILVGFPGETDELFKETYETARDLPFSYFHVFRYSDRLNNKSRLFPGKVDADIAEERSHVLRGLGARKRRLYLQQNIGRSEPVLFEQRKNGLWDGLTDTYIRVRVPSQKALENTMRRVKLKAIKDNSIQGILI